MGTAAAAGSCGGANCTVAPRRSSASSRSTSIPRAVASGLTVGAQQAVEIAKAMSRDVRVLIMDEPTAALSAFEVQRLFRQVRRLAASGVAILFVSHRLDEVFELSDRITVFRDGAHISTRPAGEVTEATLIRDMVGRELSDFFHRVPHDPGAVALRCRRPRAARAPSTACRSRCARARCWASPDSSAPGARRSPRPCSASPRRTRARSSAAARSSTIRQSA